MSPRAWGICMECDSIAAQKSVCCAFSSETRSGVSPALPKPLPSRVKNLAVPLPSFANITILCPLRKIMKVYIDGKYYDEQNAKISVFDHGLLYGDGIFEGIRACNGRVFKLKEHIDRLFYSAKAILLAVPLSHQQICAAVVETCRENKLRDGYI